MKPEARWRRSSGPATAWTRPVSTRKRCGSFSYGCARSDFSTSDPPPARPLLHTDADPVADDDPRRASADHPLGRLAQAGERVVDLRGIFAENRAWAAEALGQADDPGAVSVVEPVADDLAREAKPPALADSMEVALLRPRLRPRVEAETVARGAPRGEMRHECGVDLRVDDRRNVVVVRGEDSAGPKQARRLGKHRLRFHPMERL